MSYTDEYILLATDTVTYHIETLSSQKHVFRFFNIILLCGNVQLNPGPGSVEGSTNSTFGSSDSYCEMISNHLSILHLNVQSIVPKLDLIRSEADLYDILIFSERWVKSETQNETLYIENFQPPFRKDKHGRPGGGVTVYVRDTFPV